MASLNKVTLIGNLGADPETRYTGSGTAITNIRIATTEKWTDKQSGEKKEETEWHRITFFGRQAEIAGEYLTKGKQVYIEGRLKTNKYTDKDGVERWSTDIIASELKMIGSAGEGGQRQPQNENRMPPQGGGGYGAGGARSAKPQQPQQQDNFDDDDIPF